MKEIKSRAGVLKKLVAKSFDVHFQFQTDGIFMIDQLSSFRMLASEAGWGEGEVGGLKQEVLSDGGQWMHRQTKNG